MAFPAFWQHILKEISGFQNLILMVHYIGPVVQKRVNANLGLTLPNPELNFNPRLLCVVQS